MRTAGQSNGYGLRAGLHTISSMVAVLSLDGLQVVQDSDPSGQVLYSHTVRPPRVSSSSSQSGSVPLDSFLYYEYTYFIVDMMFVCTIEHCLFCCDHHIAFSNPPQSR